MIAAPTSVRVVLRLLRYATLHPFIGRRFTIATHETLRDDVAKLGAELSADATLMYDNFTNAYLQIAKYGILDLEFGVTPNAFDCDFQSGQNILRELGFGPDAASEWREAFPEFEGFISEIAAELVEDKWFLKIYAKIAGNAATGLDLVKSIRASNDLAKLPLPAEFVIVDACVTNTTYAWFSKHFYL